MIYECKCEGCSIKEYEAKMTDPVPTLCPSCGKDGFKRLISQTRFVLLGNCWASDGYEKHL